MHATTRAVAFGFLLSMTIVGSGFGQFADSDYVPPRLQQAQVAAQAAHLALGAAKDSLQTRLKANLQYQDLAAKLQAATERVDEARASGSTDLQSAAIDKMSIATEMSKFERDFAASDPVIIKAQKNADAADAAVAEIRAEAQAPPVAEPQSQFQPPMVSAVESKYDKFNDETTVSTKGDLSFPDVDGVGEMEFTAFYSFTGQVQSSPKDISLMLFCGSREWAFVEAHRESLRMMLIVDDNLRISLPVTYYTSEVDAALDPLICRETLGYDPTYDQLKAIGNATKVEAKIFTSQFNFSSEQISATKQLVATMTPPKPTTMPAPDVPATADAGDGWGGTGFIVSPDGLILTNRHVAVDEDNPNSVAKLEVFVRGNDQPFHAKIIGIDHDQDLALIKIQSDVAMPFVHFSAEDFPSPGSECNILGFPLTRDLGVSLKITHGNVTSVHQSGTNDPWATDGCDLMMDAKSNAGNSGGPLLNGYGNLIGILAAKTAAERFQESYTIGISTGHIRDFMRRCNIAIPLASADDKAMRPEDIFKSASPSVVRIRGHVGE